MEAKRAGGVVCAALFGLLSLACGSPSTGNRVSGDSHFERALLFPLNVVVAMPGELEAGAGRVDEALRGYLAERGRSVETLPYSEARSAWIESVKACMAAAAQGCKGFDGAGSLLAQRLADGREFDALIIPYLTMRPARMQLRSVKWDGVSRTLETVGEFQRSGDVELMNSFNGTTQAPSLAVFVFSHQGRKMFQGVGGLDLAHRVRIEPGKVTIADTRWNFELVQDVFSDPEHLREGVAIAFYPLLAKEEPEAR